MKVNENATFVEDGMDDDIEFDDYSEEEEDVVADIDAVSNILRWEKVDLEYGVLVYGLEYSSVSRFGVKLVDHVEWCSYIIDTVQ